MPTQADFVMPKLGLTMSEGKVARWNVAPGAPFAAGDVVVVVETDKIAYDVEAPAAGVLVDTLVQEDETVPVGTPIAHWRPADGQASAKVVPPDPPSAPPPLASPPLRPEPAAVPKGTRVVATPYSRRLARDAGLDLANIAPANGRRITAADVTAALDRRGQVTTERAETASAATAAQPAAGFAFYCIEVRADRILALMREIGAFQPDLAPAFSHFAVMAAARALEPMGAAIALQHQGGAIRRLSAEATRRLSTIIVADRAEAAPADRPVSLLVSDADGATLVGREPVGCDAVLGVGALVQVFRPDADSKPALRAEISLILCIKANAALPDASQLLGRIRDSLENPLALLAS